MITGLFFAAQTIGKNKSKLAFAPRVAVGGTTHPNIWRVFYLQSALHTKIVQHNFAFLAMVLSTGKPRVLAASSNTTVHHGASTLALLSFSILSECFGGRHNRHGGLHTRVCAPLNEKRGGFVVCLTQYRRVFDRFEKTVSPRYWFTHLFYSSSFVAPPLGFRSRASWCTELESPASPKSRTPPNFGMSLHQAAFLRLYTQQQPNYTAVSSCLWNNMDQ